MSENSQSANFKKTLELRDLVQAANDGDKQAMAALSSELSGENADALINMSGDLAYSLEQSTLKTMLSDTQKGTNLVLVEKLKQMRSELGWHTSPKFEQILIERIVQTWLRLHWLELIEAQAENRSSTLLNDDAIRIERTERRHLQAIKMLATVRKMGVAIQVNVATQVNVNGASSTEQLTHSPTSRYN